MNRVRFQPRVGRFLAAAADTTVSIFDIETTTRVHCLQVLFFPILFVPKIMSTKCYIPNG
jgi:hypothetical protein